MGADLCRKPAGASSRGSGACHPLTGFARLRRGTAWAGSGTMIFWRGAGILTLIIFIVAFLADLAIHEIFHVRNAYLSAGTIMLAAVVNWFVGNALNREMRKAGTSPFKRHSFFFIPMEWWSLPIIAFAILIFVNYRG